jgi:hypothetical protein
MAQVLFELDAATAERLNELAASEGKSASCWLADLIRDWINRGWPPAFLALAGAFPDFPTVEEIRAGGGVYLSSERLQ